MEYENEEQEGGFLQRLKDSPRTVSALIIILIVAAAIYAFSGDDSQIPAEEVEVDGDAITLDEGAMDENEDAMEDDDDDDVMEEGSMEEDAMAEQPTPAAVSQDELSETASSLPEATQDSQGYTEVAQAGDGVTHLARRATTRYLAENSADYTVTNEHRIYIEDYIKDQLGRDRLEIGDSRSVSYGLIEEAVAAAGQLNNSQLNNLSKYTSALR